MGITIIDVKIVGVCSKHRTSEVEINRDKNGKIYPDEEIACIDCALG